MLKLNIFAFFLIAIYSTFFVNLNDSSPLYLRPRKKGLEYLIIPNEKKICEMILSVKDPILLDQIHECPHLKSALEYFGLVFACSEYYFGNPSSKINKLTIQTYCIEAEKYIKSISTIPESKKAPTKDLCPQYKEMGKRYNLLPTNYEFNQSLGCAKYKIENYKSIKSRYYLD